MSHDDKNRSQPLPTPRTDALIPSQTFVDQTRLFDRQYFVPLLEHARELERALRGFTNLYGCVWDRVDGALVVMPQNVERFDAAYDVARKVLGEILWDEDEKDTPTHCEQCGNPLFKRRGELIWRMVNGLPVHISCAPNMKRGERRYCEPQPERP